MEQFVQSYEEVFPLNIALIPKGHQPGNTHVKKSEGRQETTIINSNQSQRQLFFYSRIMLFALFFYVFGLSALCAGTETLLISGSHSSHCFTVEIAKTNTEQMIGLMNRTEMAEDHGMIFVYSKPRIVCLKLFRTCCFHFPSRCLFG